MNVFGIRDNLISGYASFVTSYITVYDPKDVYGEDFPSETFRVLKKKKPASTTNTAPNAWCWRHSNTSRTTNPLMEIVHGTRRSQQ